MGAVRKAGVAADIRGPDSWDSQVGERQKLARDGRIGGRSVDLQEGGISQAEDDDQGAGF